MVSSNTMLHIKDLVFIQSVHKYTSPHKEEGKNQRACSVNLFLFLFVFILPSKTINTSNKERDAL